MNTILNYLMAFAIQISALILPHHEKNTFIFCPYQKEEGMDVSSYITLETNDALKEKY